MPSCRHCLSSGAVVAAPRARRRNRWSSRRSSTTARGRRRPCRFEREERAAIGERDQRHAGDLAEEIGLTRISARSPGKRTSCATRHPRCAALVARSCSLTMRPARSSSMVSSQAMTSRGQGEADELAPARPNFCGRPRFRFEVTAPCRSRLSGMSRGGRCCDDRMRRFSIDARTRKRAYGITCLMAATFIWHGLRQVGHFSSRMCRRCACAASRK